MDRKAIIKKIASSKASSGGGNNLRDGRGRLAVKNMTLDDKFSGATFVAECVVCSSAKIPVTELKSGKALDINPNEVGSEVSFIQLLDKHASALGNVKAFVLELYGVREDEVSEEEFMDTLSELVEKNAAFGMVIDYSTYRKVTTENKIEIVIPKWQSVKQEPGDIQAMQGWLSSLKASQQAAGSAKVATA